MVLVIERVKKARLESEQQRCEIGEGLVVFLGIEKNDKSVLAEKVADKIMNIKMFENKERRIKLSLKDINGSLILIPNFSLAAEVSGNRLSFDRAMSAALAREIYEAVVRAIKQYIACCSGHFGSFMNIEVEHSGPLNVILRI